MLAKLWKKVLMLILIIACLFNVVYKLVNNLSLERELLSSAQYIQDQQDAEKAKQEQEKETNSKEDNKGNNTNKKQENVVIVK